MVDSSKLIATYLKMADQFGQLSKATRRKVGCLIVKDENIIATGFNGGLVGQSNECEDFFPCEVYYEEKKRQYRCVLCKETYNKAGRYVCKEATKTKPEVLHSESNSITKVAKSTMSCDGAQLYVTYRPCFDCSKLIIQAGIKEVYVMDDDLCGPGDKILLSSNISLLYFTKNEIESLLSF